MKSKIEINISVIDDGPVAMRCQGQNTSKPMRYLLNENAEQGTGFKAA